MTDKANEPSEHRTADAVLNRRVLLLGGLGVAIAGPALIPSASAQALSPTPACGADPARTPAQAEGPFYTPETPHKPDFTGDGTGGTPFTLTGQVVDTRCQPVSGAILDVWHTDAQGRYDNVGYLYRGHVFADADGRFKLKTIRPGVYPGRTPHFHVKVARPGSGRVLTTQLYFPGEPANRSDWIHSSELEMRMEKGSDSAGAFLFVLG